MPVFVEMFPVASVSGAAKVPMPPEPVVMVSVPAAPVVTSTRALPESMPLVLVTTSLVVNVTLPIAVSEPVLKNVMRLLPPVTNVTFGTAAPSVTAPRTVMVCPVAAAALPMTRLPVIKLSSALLSSSVLPIELRSPTDPRLIASVVENGRSVTV